MLAVDDVDALLRRERSFGTVNRYINLGWRVFIERLVVSLFLPTLFFGVLLVVTLSLQLRTPALWVLFAGVVGLYILFGAFPTRSLRPIMRSLGICWSCGYDIRALVPEHDGCTVCPECGAAWRLPVDANNPV